MSPVDLETKALTERYGDRTHFLQTFWVGNQTRFTNDEGRCYFGSAPTLAKVNAAYGRKTAQEWLVYQLADLSEFSGAKKKITPNQIQQMAELIANDYHWLKITELMLFFRKFKKGEYGEFYGAVDPITVMKAIKSFVRDRNEAYSLWQAKQAVETKGEGRECITYEQYLSLTNKQTE